MILSIVFQYNQWNYCFQYQKEMTDKILYQQIRQLVRGQKERNVLDSRSQDFAQEYCRTQMLKKRQLRPQQPSKISNLFKNFKNVESYINIMDIVNNLPMFINAEDYNNTNSDVNEELPQIIPRSIQMKIKQQLGPILSIKYDQECARRQAVIEQLKSQVGYGNASMEVCNNLLKQLEEKMSNGQLKEKLELVDMLRKDIKKKEIYFIEKRFDQQIKDIQKIPKKLQDTKIFHKICSYLHMVLEQQHKEKWASRKDKMIRQVRREHSRRQIRLSVMFKSVNNSPVGKFQRNAKHNHSRFKSDFKNINDENKIAGRVSVNNIGRTSFSQTANLDESIYPNIKKTTIINPMRTTNTAFIQKNKKIKSKNDQLKENFTFRKRGIKAGLMVKINDFVESLTEQQKKNLQTSKKYGKALQSLSQQLKTSYGRFERQEIAQQEDIDEMKKYLDNTLSRNKSDLKKFHHR